MMGRLGIQMTVRCDVEQLLKTLSENRTRHQKVVEEARQGFLKVAEERLLKQVAQLKEGKIKRISVNLSPPEDMSSAYTTALKMLELHTEDTIELSASEVRMFVEDEWDWADKFWTVNAAYSKTSADVAAMKGLL